MILPEITTHLERQSHPHRFFIELTADLGPTTSSHAVTIHRTRKGAWRILNLRGEWLGDFDSFKAAAEWLRDDFADDVSETLEGYRDAHLLRRWADSQPVA